ncbi:hypothetical protein AVEN_152841-1 [Araneus ventricosus]|uniref:Uncharacterized protein n=1 Tax=Araneus ventricosus TaxID=182803 RepID=A0A4Y2ST10_ARAVE|nr:hypothetical protein AVEN_6223-1 [Araneus ventricosus]GBN91432.1 hypothetical protein AVEN_117000-1 [Araneus ventricosus]GBN91472.1 hypothetical protein AVEN_239250-1 [Araneus ventricosus]GBN91475.1 hypothetical protein AVEN_74660-1 [Araneus ventricosus]GBO05619.1 hypothetical protein AVEN_152841-1 [Araneus ventricosus]
MDSLFLLSAFRLLQITIGLLVFLFNLWLYWYLSTNLSRVHLNLGMRSCISKQVLVCVESKIRVVSPIADDKLYLYPRGLRIRCLKWRCNEFKAGYAMRDYE